MVDVGGNMRKAISIILIIVGICICAVPFVGRYYIKYQQDKMYEEYLATLKENTKNMDDAFNEAPASKEDSEEKELNKNISGTIGAIEIPKIDVKQIILEGSDARALRYGIGHVTETAFPGGAGNCCLAGHRNGTFGTYFSRIGELKKGDEITCEYNGENYKYKVSEVFIVKPEDVKVLEGKEDEHVLTLISCHPRGKTTHRIIIRAELES